MCKNRGNSVATSRWPEPSTSNFQDVATGRNVVMVNPKSKMLVLVFPVLGAKPTHVWSTCPPATKRHSLQISSIPPNIYVTIIWIHYIPVVVLCGCATHAKFHAKVHSNWHPLVVQPCAVATFGSVHPVFVAHLHTVSGDQLQNTPLK